MTLFTMKFVLLLNVAYVLHCKGPVAAGDSNETTELNDRPIIGVLAQEQSFNLKDKYPENYTSYIAASYVKGVEASGARVVPVMIGKNRTYYRQIMNKINGVLLPGGATYFNQSGGYADAGQYIYEIAQEMNAAGDYFPIFGTCLGFELLIILASGREKQENREPCCSNSNMPLYFTDDFRNSKMFKSTPQDIIDLLAKENITINHHQFCITDKNMKHKNLTNDWMVTSHSDDDDGLKFISSVEHKRFPFYGVQFHPEKVPFEWKLSKKYPHSYNAVKANRYFMDFFVRECRKNLHKFENAAEENEYVIYNYNPKFTGLLGSLFEQCYFFNQEQH